MGVKIGDPSRIFQIVWQGRTIPFETIEESRRNESGDEYILVRFGAFGGSAYANQYGIKPYRFPNGEERRHVMMLAAEALLVFGSDYDGSAKPEGFYRVEHEGKVYTNRDFGIL
jgi:hypothetical protein